VHSNAAKILEQLIAIETTSHLSNRPLVEWIADFLDRPGVAIEFDQHGDKVNLVVRIGPENCGPEDRGAKDCGRAGLTLCGHTDTVPADEEGWENSPFRLHDAGDRWVARGSCDMKGFLALATDRAARLDPTALRAPLALLFTADEEIGSLGARRFVSGNQGRAPLPRATLIGEPTELAVVRLHKGHLRARLTFEGRSAHSGYPHRGINAVAAAGEAMAALSGLARTLEQEPTPSGRYFPEVPHVVLNLARVEGGGATNVVPDSCTLDFGLRLLPESDPEELLERVRGAVSGVVTPASWTLETINLSPAMSTPDSAPLHRDLCAETGQEGTRSASFSSDAGLLSQLDLDCVLFGPGSIEVAHKPNEYLPKAEFERAGEVLDRLIADNCGVSA
jgi:acetylornithine deacetylase